MKKTTFKERIIEGGQALYEDLGNGMTEVTIVSPIKLVSTMKAEDEEGYLLIIEDALGYEHFWNPDGSYDGWEAPVK